MVDISNLTFNMDDLTLDEMEIIEDIIDAPIDSLNDPKMEKSKALKAMALVAARRIDPNVTLEDIGAVQVSQFGDDGGSANPN